MSECYNAVKVILYSRQFYVDKIRFNCTCSKHVFVVLFSFYLSQEFNQCQAVT